MALFAMPWALVALLAIPVLAAIYWLRNRYRRVPVSSLMLWVQERENRAGGLHVRRLQTPLVFFLEILAIVLLVLAAAGPLLSSTDASQSLVVVLDDSYSMLAGAPDSAQSRGRTAVAEEIRQGRYQTVRFVLAGDRPQVLGASVRSGSEALVLLDGWRGRAPAADLDAAIGLATELGGPGARILIVTDHAPATALGSGPVQGRAFGTARPNTAFVSAARSPGGGKERCSFEITNFSPTACATSLVIETGSPASVLRRSRLQLAAMETRRIVLELPAGTPSLTARIDGDALEIDNRVILVPDTRPPVRVAVQLKEPLQGLVEKALKASGRALITTLRPEILFTSGDDIASGNAWQVQMLTDKEAEAYVGPFVMERTHPLTQGLSLDGVVWGAGKAQEVTGVPIILAGNVPLLTETEGAGGAHVLRLHLRPDLSTLQESPSWPILIWNILEWRLASRTGLQRVNLRLGEQAVLTTAAGVESIRVTDPRGVTHSFPVHDGRAVIRADEVGRYAIEAGDQHYIFAVNALNREESNLTQSVSGRWGEWVEPTSGTSAIQSASWILLLAAAAVLTLHLWLVASKSRKGDEP
jgi:hypothetical protein